MTQINLLIIDDDEDDFVLTREIIEDIPNFEASITWIGDYDKAKESLCTHSFDLALIDYRLGKENGVTLIQTAIIMGVDTPMIILTGKGDRHIDNEAMQQGASDYLVKDEISAVIMERCIRYALNNAENLRIIKQSESKFKQLFDRSLDAIFISDCDHKILDANDAMLKLLNFSLEELVGQKMANLCLGCDDFNRFEKQLVNDSQVVDFEIDLIDKHGDEVVCQISSVARMDAYGKIIGYQGIIRDIALKKIAEKELILAEKLSLTGKIARSVAHEVRNPLTNLTLAMEQLKDEIPDTEEIALFVGIIERNAKRIDHLISELMDSSKDQFLEKIPYNINDLLKETTARIRDRIILRKLSLVEDYAESVPVIHIDLQQMKTAFLNILVNAVEAVEDNVGELYIATKFKGDSINIEIKDNGCGIAPESLKNMFDPFFTQKQGGKGLGLTSTQAIIKNHDGMIEVTSKLNVETVFRIALPCS